eukprot:TRINITY_DN6759_c0_g5_i1.p1 TRINITY_DN6759_c0_g5~~TRINITY_DN6759_c0_g5_i1.p1  ORF type:complete len:307 (-),score=14.44 TRINITY_DN6759_c0_g5_i1:435-1256(-)
MDNTGNTVRDWYESIPPITRAIGTAIFASTCLYTIGLFNPMWIYYDQQLIFQKLQIWRLITPMFFLGKFSLNFFFNLLWFVKYAPPLERNVFQFNPADYVVFYLFCAAMFCLIQTFYPPAGLYFFASPMVFAVIYLWSRNFPNEVMSLYGVVRIRSFYLPFAFAGMSLLFTGEIPVQDIIGIVVGHLFYFLTVLYPQQSGGRNLLKAPQFLAQWLAQVGIGSGGYYPAPRAGSGAQTSWTGARGQQQQQSQSQGGGDTGGFRAFSGQGRRLAD